MIDSAPATTTLVRNYSVTTLRGMMGAPAKARFEGTVQPWGNSLGIRITRPIGQLARLGKGDKVAIEVTEDGLLITRKEPDQPIRFPYTEADLIAGMTPEKAHADELPSLLDHELGD